MLAGLETDCWDVLKRAKLGADACFLLVCVAHGCCLSTVQVVHFTSYSQSSAARLCRETWSVVVSALQVGRGCTIVIRSMHGQQLLQVQRCSGLSLLLWARVPGLLQQPLP